MSDQNAFRSNASLSLWDFDLIKAGLSEPLTDSSGQVWKPDEGFEGGGMSPLAGGSRGAPGGPGGFARSRDADLQEQASLDHPLALQAASAEWWQLRAEILA